VRTVEESRWRAQPEKILRLDGIRGSLSVRAWDKNEVEARADGPLLEIHETAEAVTVGCAADALVLVPPHQALEIGEVLGDVDLRDLKGAVRVSSVAASLSARHGGALQVGQVGADADIRHAAGAVELVDVGGSIRIRHCAGGVRARSGGNAAVRHVHGEVSVTAGGNADVEIDRLAESGVTVSAGGNVRIRLPAHEGVTLRLSSAANAVTVEGDGGSRGGREAHDLQLGWTSARGGASWCREGTRNATIRRTSLVRASPTWPKSSPFRSSDGWAALANRSRRK
jgi:hypothetical protein